MNGKTSLFGRAFPAAPAAALLALGLAGCGGSTDAGGGATAVIPVQMAVAAQQDMPRLIDSIGTVQSLRTVAIKSQVDGIIAEIHFREGDEVKVGDVLISLDRRPFENSLAIARADLANARAEESQAAKDADRYTHLDQTDAISKEQFAQILTKAETSRAQVQAKEAAVANAELQLSYTQIRAPIAGRTGQLQLHEGALVKANDVTQVIVTLNQLAPIAVAFAVPEDTLGGIRSALAAGTVGVAVTEKSSGTTRTDGKLEFVDNAVDPSTATITLKAVFANADHALWPGQFVHVETQVGIDRGAVVIPTSAIQTGQTGSQVYVVKADHSVELRPVKIGRTVDDRAIIQEGVHAGETVVTDGQLRLVPGAKVEAKSVNGASAAPAAGPAS
ncbi:MAG TPA: efflux RND transporter periplasmic adaptor subunit [Opitutaceae bacterium]|nr:efflux RND transporter periplasmic adaptor subunit [Opitutaceae bacterium]